MPDADEVAREDMPKEAPQKLFDPKRDHPFLVVMGRIAPAKAPRPVLQFNQSVVGDGDTVRVIAQVPENVLRAAEWSFGVDHPLVAAAWAE